MDRVQEFELWEKNKRLEMQYIKTSGTGNADQPQIFYMPKEHNDKTMAKYEKSLALIEEELKTAKTLFEEDLLKIENKLNVNNPQFGEDEVEDYEEDFEAENKFKSVIVKQDTKTCESANRRSSESADATADKAADKVTDKVTSSPPEKIVTGRDDLEKIKVTIKNDAEKPERLIPKDKIKVEGERKRKPENRKSENRKTENRKRSRKNSSSSDSSGSSDSSDDSDSSSDDSSSEEDRKRKKIKLEKD